MGRDFDSQCHGGQVAEVEIERTASPTAGGQRRPYDAADWIQKLARHEHQHHDHQRLGHVVLGLRLLRHVLVKPVKLTKSFDQTIGHGRGSLQLAQRIEMKYT